MHAWSAASRAPSRSSAAITRARLSSRACRSSRSASADDRCVGRWRLRERPGTGNRPLRRRMYRRRWLARSFVRPRCEHVVAHLERQTVGAATLLYAAARSSEGRPPRHRVRTRRPQSGGLALDHAHVFFERHERGVSKPMSNACPSHMRKCASCRQRIIAATVGGGNAREPSTSVR